jgi:hypothetical protein
MKRDSSQLIRGHYDAREVHELTYWKHLSGPVRARF